MKVNRTLVCGDIHGGLRAFEQVFEDCNYNYDNDRLVFLGDYVDGWNESCELVERLIQIKNESKIEPIFLLGNHDAWCRDWLIWGRMPHYWTEQGGRSTVDSYIRNDMMNGNHNEWFNNLKNWWIDEKGRAYVHGGWTNSRGLGYDDERTYTWDRNLWNLAVLQHGREKDANDIIEKNRGRMWIYPEVYIGHTTTGNWDIKKHYPEYDKKEQAKNGQITVPMYRCNVWNLDTGGGWEGKLTIMDVDNKDIWQSDFVKDLYPNERGR